MKPSMIKEFTKANKLSQGQAVIDRKVIHHEKKNTCTFVKEEKSREEKVKSVELNLCLELNAFYVTLVGNVRANPFTCDLAFDIDHMLKCSSLCSYFEKQLLVLEVHPCDLVKTTFENGVFELALKDLNEKLVYPISFIDYLLNRDILKDILVQNTTCVKLLNQSFGGILLYSLTFKEFLDELISLLYCKKELGGLSIERNGTLK
ncbi:hypothetical protein M9H77_36406 [Catharanthus roseus]|uniref:Uncharacterized protein n=1 Tax=Catharanthus roseus TaxID=4058 RepID=A0ACB9ZT12_CATRO|nr:hypothetical protein M9H77_36406 [Catharanthus roseus]